MRTFCYRQPTKMCDNGRDVFNNRLVPVTIPASEFCTLCSFWMFDFDAPHRVKLQSSRRAPKIVLATVTAVLFPHTFPDVAQSSCVKMCSFTHCWDAHWKTAYCDYDAETLDAVLRTYFGVCNQGDDIERTLWALSNTSADHDGFRLVRVKRQTVE